jgi:hypothetical protein
MTKSNTVRSLRTVDGPVLAAIELIADAWQTYIAGSVVNQETPTARRQSLPPHTPDGGWLRMIFVKSGIAPTR